ncbi:MFS transporter [Mycobacterium simiae]|uniref:MFS transporter n=1 Tax=Mycobacterium simiae TaxID=1784 RepID=A0A5B1BVV6_MYCSI|nr:MFS transporter [Mycobacterium simiae]
MIAAAAGAAEQPVCTRHPGTPGDVRGGVEKAARAAGSCRMVGPARHRYPAAIWLLLAGSLLVRSTGRSHAAGAAGAVLAIYCVGWATGQLRCGWLVDQYGARTTLMSTMSVAAVALILTAATTVAVGLLGTALCAPLARVLPGGGPSPCAEPKFPPTTKEPTNE